MNNEPVVWMVQYKGKHDFTFYKPVSHDDAVVIPLYTHPVDAVNISEQYVDKTQNNRHDLGIAEAIGFEKGYKAASAKTLTDEEILKLYVNNSTYDNDQKLFIDIYGFARAILRKAQEK